MCLYDDIVAMSYLPFELQRECYYLNNTRSYEILLFHQVFQQFFNLIFSQTCKSFWIIHALLIYWVLYLSNFPIKSWLFLALHTFSFSFEARWIELAQLLLLIVVFSLTAKKQLIEKQIINHLYTELWVRERKKHPIMACSSINIISPRLESYFVRFHLLKRSTSEFLFINLFTRFVF